MTSKPLFIQHDKVHTWQFTNWCANMDDAAFICECGAFKTVKAKEVSDE